MPKSELLSDAEAALLGLLCEQPMHPWKIEQVVEFRDMRFWTDLSQSTIYKQLRALQQRKLVECEQKVADGRLRKVFSITKTGREAMKAKIRELLSEPQHLKCRVDLGTYNMDLLPAKEAIACLEQYRQKVQEFIKCYRELDKFLISQGCPPHRRAVARRPGHLFKGELKWLDQYLAELRKA